MKEEGITNGASYETFGGGTLDSRKSFEDLLKENKDYQSEFDKKVKKALDTSKIKLEEDFKLRLEKEKEDLEKGIKLSIYEKKLGESESSKTQFKELTLKVLELRLELLKVLNEKKLPITFLDLILELNAEEIKNKVSVLEKEFYYLI